MKFEKTEVFGFEAALRGMRNPKNSWDRSDSYNDNVLGFVIGEKDMKLAQSLIRGGPVHSKFLRYIHVQVDITAPRYWWSEYDTYKVGTVANSTSTMHKLAETPITIDCFETDDYDPQLIFESGIDNHGDELYNYNIHVDDVIGINENRFWNNETFIGFLESLRLKYLETKDVRYWKELVRWLPAGWLQTRTVDLNYEVLRNIYKHRKNHKLLEWSVSFVDWIKTLPYSKEFILFDN